MLPVALCCIAAGAQYAVQTAELPKETTVWGDATVVLHGLDGLH